MVEGSLMSVGQRHHIDEDPRYIDTTGILFVASGAFVGITDTDLRNLRPQDIRRRLMNENVIIAHDVINFGFVPELVARFQVTVQFMDLTTDELCQIMTAPDTSPITVWVNHFEELGKKLVVEPAAIRAISSRALMLELGARGLQQILFELLAEISYGFETSEEGSYTLTEQEVMKGWRN
jgi:ATP-dependent Clp protease ATP-binding subunit ClpX